MRCVDDSEQLLLGWTSTAVYRKLRRVVRQGRASGIPTASVRDSNASSRCSSTGKEMGFLRITVCVLCALVLFVTLVALGIAITVSQTVLNPSFVTSELEEIDVHLLAAEQLKQELPQEASFLAPIIDDAAGDLETWARQQVSAVVYAANAYLKGRQPFRVVISFEEPKSYLKMRLAEVLGDSPPQGFPNIPASEAEAFVEAVETEIDARIPDEMEVDEAYLGAETMSELRTARRYTGYVTTSLRVLPVVAAVMVLIIVLVQKGRGRPISRFTGTAFALGGAASLVTAFVVRSTLPGMVRPEIPTEIGVALPDIVNRCCQPLFIYGGIVLLVGLGLVALSFRLKSTEY